MFQRRVVAKKSSEPSWLRDIAFSIGHKGAFGRWQSTLWSVPAGRSGYYVVEQHKKPLNLPNDPQKSAKDLDKVGHFALLPCQGGKYEAFVWLQDEKHLRAQRCYPESEGNVAALLSTDDGVDATSKFEKRTPRQTSWSFSSSFLISSHCCVT